MLPFKRFIATMSALLLLLLGAQLMFAQYSPNGPVGVSTLNPQPGGTVTVSGDGFAPGSDVRLTIESTPVLLATVTADGSGAFAAAVRIPANFSGSHRLVATGTDPAGSVRILATAIIVGIPATDTLASANAPVAGSDPFVIAVAASGIVALTVVMLFVSNRRRAGR